MCTAYNIGLPVPRVLSYGGKETFSIWMTRLPGRTLSEVIADESVSYQQLLTIYHELDACLQKLRRYRSPNGTAIESLTGGCITSYRVPCGVIPPCRDEAVFIEYMLKFANDSYLPADKRSSFTEWVRTVRAGPTNHPHVTVLTHPKHHGT